MQLSPRATRHRDAIQRAMDCAELGARVRTIRCVTGLAPRMLQRLLFSDSNAIPRGRAPDSPEWYHSANLLYRTDASLFSALYQRLRRSGFGPADALTGGYRHYRLLTPTPARISFDRAFDLAAHTDGLWLTESRSFSLVVCPACHSEFLAAFGSVALSNDDCPFCKLVQRYGSDPRVQSSFPAQPLANPSAMQLGMLILLQGTGVEPPAQRHD